MRDAGVSNDWGITFLEEQGPVAPSMVSANNCLKKYRNQYVALVVNASADHVSRNSGHNAKNERRVNEQ